MKFDKRDMYLEKMNEALNFVQSYGTDDGRVILCAKLYVAMHLNGNTIYNSIEELWKKEYND